MDDDNDYNDDDGNIYDDNDDDDTHSFIQEHDTIVLHYICYAMLCSDRKNITYISDKK